MGLRVGECHRDPDPGGQPDAFSHLYGDRERDSQSNQLTHPYLDGDAVKDPLIDSYRFPDLHLYGLLHGHLDNDAFRDGFPDPHFHRHRDFDKLTVTLTNIDGYAVQDRLMDSHSSFYTHGLHDSNALVHRHGFTDGHRYALPDRNPDSHRPHVAHKDSFPHGEFNPDFVPNPDLFDDPDGHSDRDAFRQPNGYNGLFAHRDVHIDPFHDSHPDLDGNA
jgi:hypothetical protein